MSLCVYTLVVECKKSKASRMSTSPRYNPQGRVYRHNELPGDRNKGALHTSHSHRRGYSSPKDDVYIKTEIKEEDDVYSSPSMRDGPNFELSGLLAETQNQVQGVALTFSLPMDSAKPDDASQDWRLYEFTGDENTRVVKLRGYACFLFGKDSRLTGASIPDELEFVHLTNAMCSRQHAVIQFRRRESGVVPYIMDLNSTNKTMLNHKPIEPGKYIELRHQDVVNFGHTSCEYVILNATVSN
jgi:smad nuclear-interacting protein 1